VTDLRVASQTLKPVADRNIAFIIIINIFAEQSNIITYMKKALLTICFAAASLVTFAQLPTFGIRGGVNFASQSISASGLGVSVASGTLTTFNAGVFADFKFANISLQPALNFTGKGAKYSGDITDANGNDAGSGTVTERLYYLQLPVNVVYHIPVLVGNVYFGAGPYIAKGISGSARIPGGVDTGNGTTTGSTSETIHFGNNENDIKPMQYGADFILGVEFKTGFLIHANYDLGLSNDFPAADGSGLSSKSRVFGFSVGYKF